MEAENGKKPSESIFWEKLGNADQWTSKKIGKVLDLAVNYAVPCREVMQFGLKSDIRSAVLADILLFYQKRPECSEEIHSAISDYLVSQSAATILMKNATQQTRIEVETGKFINSGHSVASITPEQRNLIRISKLPGNVDGEQIDLLAIATEDAIAFALASKEKMRAALSSIVPKIVEGNPKAIEILQRIMAAPGGEPAIIVAKELKSKRGIDCFI